MNLDDNSTFASKRKIQPLILVFFAMSTMIMITLDTDDTSIGESLLSVSSQFRRSVATVATTVD